MRGGGGGVIGGLDNVQSLVAYFFMASLRLFTVNSRLNCKNQVVLCSIVLSITAMVVKLTLHNSTHNKMLLYCSSLYFANDLANMLYKLGLRLFATFQCAY